MPVNTMSAAKANHLFWLGRYAERVYLSLHFLRRYTDRQIDGDEAALGEYHACLDVPYPRDGGALNMAHIYDKGNPASLIAGITAANDNAVLLREEIKSESLSYIQMSLALVERCKAAGETRIDALQEVTDSLLAFWGSVDSRPLTPRVRLVLRVGKLVEDMDMHLRFGYPYERILEYFTELIDLARIEPRVFSQPVLRSLAAQMATRAAWKDGDDAARFALLPLLAQLVTV